MKNSKKTKIIIDLAVLVVVAIALAVSMAWSQTIELNLGLLYYVESGAVRDEDIVELKKSGGARDASTPQLNVHFVDVGQGDCAIIELPDGKTMLIDGGEKKSSVVTAITTFIEQTLPSDFTYFDYAILTHADSDHCGSFDDVLYAYPSRVVYRPNVEAIGTASKPYTDPGKADLTADAVTKNTTVYAEAVAAMYQTTADFTSVVYVTDPTDETQAITGGTGDSTYTFNFYSPLGTKYTGEGQWNNYSPIMILEYQGFKYAMSGDAEEKNLGEFVQKVTDAKTDGVTDKYDAFDDDYCVNVIKAGHHGSRNATTLDYLNVLTSPQSVQNVYCVISCGAGNSYGHPHQEALDRYAAIGVPDENILRTDEKGDITISVKVNENGEYALFYGENSTQNPEQPDVPDDPNTPEQPSDPDIGDSDDKEIEQLVLTYRKLGNIKLKWAVVAWTAYGVLAVVAIIHIVYICLASDNGKSSGGNGGGTRSSGGGKRKSGNRR